MTLLDRFDKFQFESVSVEKDISIPSGDSRLFVIRAVDEDTGVPIDLTNCRVYLTVAESFVDPEYNRLLVEKSSIVYPQDLYVQNGPDGILVWHLRGMDTINLVPRKYPYALTVANASGVQTVLAGQLQVRRTVGKLSGKYFWHEKHWRGVEVDGTRFEFELDKTPEPSGLIVSVDGIIQTLGEDFILNGKVMMFNSGAPVAGSEVDAGPYPSLEA